MFFKIPKNSNNTTPSPAFLTLVAGNALLQTYADQRYGTFDPDAYNVLSQQFFHWMLALERKKSERSGCRFLLMLVDVSDLEQQTSKRAIDQFLRTLVRSTRDTDVKGWYNTRRTVLGVILSELAAGTLEDVRGTLADKVRKSACESVGSTQAGLVHLSWHIFPEQGLSADGPSELNLTIYPEHKDGSHAKRSARILKRMLDIVGSSVGLVLSSPLFLLIAITIKLTSNGPVLFQQKRVGYCGKPFWFFKFRSMYLSNDDSIHRAFVDRFMSGAGERTGKNEVFKIVRDPRVTPIGRLLRRSSLDELPQLINVLRGQMALVGPRPPLPYEFSRYEIWQKRRLAVKPGITGLWQVNGRSRVTFNDMVRMDLQYASSWSLWLDFKILLKTPGAVLSGNGAY